MTASVQPHPGEGRGPKAEHPISGRRPTLLNPALLGPGLRRGGTLWVVAVAFTGWATQALATPPGGVPPRSGLTPIELALLVAAAFGVFLIRRALRKRFLKRPPKD